MRNLFDADAVSDGGSKVGSKSRAEKGPGVENYREVEMKCLASK